MVTGLSFAASVVGMILGTAGFVLGVLNYLRDRPRIKVRFNMNMINRDSKHFAGMVVVTNVGRRAVHIGAVAIEPPDMPGGGCLLLNDSIGGAKIGEGDSPLKHLVPVELLIPYRNRWREIRAFAEDSTGQRFYSSRVSPKTNVPGWVNQSDKGGQA